MRKIIILAAIPVVVAIVAWSIAMLGKPKISGDVRDTETSTSVSPHELMVKQGSSIPVEYWAHPF